MLYLTDEILQMPFQIDLSSHISLFIESENLVISKVLQL